MAARGGDDMATDALQTRLQHALSRRERIGTLRKLQTMPSDCLDFASNDYLGLAHSRALHDLVEHRRHQLLESEALLTTGSTGSRLISGNSSYYMQVESELAAFYNSEAALLFGSGYTANLGVLSSLPQAHDIVLYDELVHNSCHEGLRLSRAHAHGRTRRFRHNDVADLESKLQEIQQTIRPPPPTSEQSSDIRTDTDQSARPVIFIVVESVYSMDGDLAPLIQMVALAERYQAHLIVDEAHGVGVYGPQGSGLVRELGLDAHGHVLCCRVVTFGKAMGCHGAVVCGSQALIAYLVNYARSFIYTTAPPVDQLVTIQCAHEFCSRADVQRQRVLDLVQYFRRAVARFGRIPPDALLPSDSPIQGVVFAGNHRVLAAAQHLATQRIRVIAIRSPTVPVGSERFRVIIRADHSEADIDALVGALNDLFRTQPHKPNASSRL